MEDKKARRRSARIAKKPALPVAEGGKGLVETPPKKETKANNNSYASDSDGGDSQAKHKSAFSGNDGAVWLSTNPSKRWGEAFFLYTAIFWLVGMGSCVAFKFYLNWSDWGYNSFGVFLTLPYFVVPLVWTGEADKDRPLFSQYWVKANLWQAIFGFIGNYFWTHYFFQLLGAAYTLPVEYKLNEIPYVMYLLTHAYFVSYHALTTPALRRFWTGPGKNMSPFFAYTCASLLVIAMALFTAFMETFTIASFPYYTFTDRAFMYTVGTTFYALYFVVSFPMFARLDEEPGANWSLSRTAIDSLASAMMVFLLCDFWRLAACAYFPHFTECPVPYGACNGVDC